MPPARPKTARAASSKGSSSSHTLRPVTAGPPPAKTGKRARLDYVEISSSDSDEPPAAPAETRKKSKAATNEHGSAAATQKSKPPGKQVRSKGIPSAAAPVPPPPAVAAAPASRPSPTPDPPSPAPRPSSPTPRRPPLRTYPHEASVSRSEVESSWVLLDPAARAQFHIEVQDAVRKTVAALPPPATSADHKTAQAVEATLYCFIDDFDRVIASLPVPPLPPGLLPSEPDPKKITRAKKKDAGIPQPSSVGQAPWSVAALERRLADLERAYAEKVSALEALEVGDAAAAAGWSDPPALADPVSRVEKKR
ncbi:hypothetical protein JCM8202v2_005251 [Rhodotorula sphaerocarpa]